MRCTPGLGKSPKGAGIWRGLSNYLPALSKGLLELVDPIEEATPRIHFNRGDGGSWVNLTGWPG